MFTLTARLSQRELLKKQEALLSIAPALRYVMNERVKQSGSSPVPGAGRWESPERRAGSRGSCHIVSGLLEDEDLKEVVPLALGLIVLRV